MKFRDLWQKDTAANTGQQGEQLAEAFLKHQGLVTEARNYRHRVGEIDLIMLDGDVRVFIEVRLRQHRNFSSASESITRSKQQKIIRAAEAYLQQHDPNARLACRFDVIALSSLEPQAAPEWIKSAFDAV
ncbi:MAG TPA: YraN family protein [Cellvibrionaceae bacterium]